MLNVELLQKYYPNLKIEFKDESIFMKLINKFLFFNRDFMTTTTTIGNSIYFPSKNFIERDEKYALSILFHELTHIYDSLNMGQLIFTFLYTLPQSLSLISIPLYFLGFKFFALLSLLFLLPIPSITRSLIERRGYLVQLYVLNYLIKNGYNFDLDDKVNRVVKSYQNSMYYFMFPISFIIKKWLEISVNKIKNNEKPFESPLFTLIDNILPHMFKD